MASDLVNIRTGLLTYMRLEEASGTRADHLGNLSFAPVNTPGNRSGKFGNAVDFIAASAEGLDSASSNDLDFDGTGDFSGAFWFIIDNTTQHHVCAAKWTVVGDDRQWLVEQDTAGGDMEFALSDDGTGTGTVSVARSNAFSTTGVLAFCYFEFNNSTGRMEVVVNEGTPNTTPNHTAGIFQSASVVQMGTADLGVSPLDQMDGGVDELTIWNRRLTSTERAAVYNGGTGVDLTINNFRAEFTADVAMVATLTTDALRNIDANLLSFYPLEETSGQALDFLDTNSLNAGGSPGTRTGAFREARDFIRGDGDNFAAGASSVFDFDGTGDFTIVCRVLLDTLTLTGDACVIGKFDDDGASDDRQYILFFDDSTDSFRFLISEDGAATSADVNLTGFTPSTGTFYLLFASYEASTRTIRLRIDEGGGSKEGTAVATNAVINQSAALFRLGSSVNTAGNMFWDGAIDEVGVWSRLLNLSEEEAFYNEGTPINLRAFIGSPMAAAVDVDVAVVAPLGVHRGLAAPVTVDADFIAALTVQAFGGFRAFMDISVDIVANFVTADFDAYTNALLSLGGEIVEVQGLSPNLGNPPVWQIETLLDLGLPGSILAEPVAGTPAPPAGIVHDAYAQAQWLGETWFDRLYVLPTSVSAGFVAAPIAVEFQVYSSFKVGSHSLDTLVNNVDSGITFQNLPILPETLLPQKGFGFQVIVSPIGPPTIIGTLDFGFDLYGIPVPFNGTRVDMLAVEPVVPVLERLRWNTDVQRAKGEFERRIQGRNTPRQTFDLRWELDGQDRQIFEATVFNRHGGVLTLPVWDEPMEPTADVTAGSFTIPVFTTDYTDLRVDGFATVWESSGSFEILGVASFTKTSITFKTSFLTNHLAINTWVYPVRIGHLRDAVRGSKRPDVIQTYRGTFQVVDNDVDLSDTSAFPSFNGKVLLDEPNWLPAASGRGDMERRIFFLDGDTGPFQGFSEFDRDRDLMAKRWLCDNRQRLWQVRQLLHALKGRQVSFYIPSFYKDFTPIEELSLGDDKMDIARFGYTGLVQGRTPRDVIWIRFTDGTTLIRTIIGQITLTDTTEQIQVDSPWPATIQVDEIERVSLLFKARLNTDEITINHKDARGNATVDAPVISVIE